VTLLTLWLLPVVVLTLASVLWWGLHQQYGRRLTQARGQHDQLRQALEESLRAAQNRLASTRQQLLESQLELKKARRTQAPAPNGAHSPAATESLLLMLDRESSEPMAAEGAYDKTLKLRRRVPDAGFGQDG